MYDAVEVMERHGRVLARLTELGLALAERARAQALAAMDGEAPPVAELGLTFHRISRSVRQSIALEAKLVRDAARAEREAAAEAEHKRTAICAIPSPWSAAKPPCRRPSSRSPGTSGKGRRPTISSNSWTPG